MVTDAVRSSGNAAVQRPDGVMSWPFSLIPDTTYCQPADLTQIGVEQHLQNGQILRQVTCYTPHTSHKLLLRGVERNAAHITQTSLLMCVETRHKIKETYTKVFILCSHPKIFNFLLDDMSLKS